MDSLKYRAWVFSRQGLQDKKHWSARETLALAGWQRSVGGVNPYIAIRARSGEGRADVDELALKHELFELPSARGCTYVLPVEHFALGLVLGRGHGSATELATARKLGIQDSEVEALKDAIVTALSGKTMAPADIKSVLGEQVRHLGEEGKRRGMITTLPLALGLLQTEGRIRRKPLNGRLDTQRYAYEVWEPALNAFPGENDAAIECARLFFTWIGAATLKDFCEFSGLGVRAAQATCDRAGIVAFVEDTPLLSLQGAHAEFLAYERPSKPCYSLVTNMDSFLHLRRQTAYWLDPSDESITAPTDKGPRPLGGLTELWSHPILDRGRLVGLWEFDGYAGEIAWTTWCPVDESLLAAIEAINMYIRNDLGDARSFSLDSPASRRPRIDDLRKMQVALQT